MFILSETPATFTVKLKDQTAKESEVAVFQCETNKPQKVTWRKLGKELKIGKNVEIKDMGTLHQLVFKNIRREDTGEVIAEIPSGKKTQHFKYEISIISIWRRLILDT